MSELRALVTAGRALRRQGKPFLVATLVSVKGSSYRRPGARLLIAEDRWTVGSVSGGCLERDLVRRAWWRTDNGDAALVTYDSTGDEDDLGWGMGLGCNGVVELLLERDGGAGRTALDAVDAVGFIGDCLDDERPGALVTVFRAPRGELPLGGVIAVRDDRATRSVLAARAAGGASAGLVDVARAALRTLAPPRCVTLPGGVEALVEVIRPPPHLFILGGGPDAVPLVHAARGVGWTVTVWAPHAGAEAGQRFAGAHRVCSGPVEALGPAVNAAHRSLAVVMSHNFSHDRQALAMLLGSACRYIGVLGPRRRAEKLLAGRPDAPDVGGEVTDPRLHAPVGLAIGAETPDEVALSIVAEAQAVLAGESAGYLRDRAGAIHHPAADVATAGARSLMSDAGVEGDERRAIAARAGAGERGR